jgi:cation diffusion facilitator family transporter
MAAHTREDHPALKGIRPVVTGGIVNAFLVIIKITAGILGNSYALIADGIESATDILSSAILWLGLRVAAKAPDTDHPYGHGKAEPLAGAFVALALFGAAVAIVFESIHNIRTPHHLPKPFTLYILGAIILLKEFLFRYEKKIGKELKSMAINADAWHHRSDAISSAAAFIGIAFALIMGPGYESADDWAAIVASVVIAVNAYQILNPALAEMMDAAPSAHIVQEIKEVAAKVEGVTGLDKCHVRKMGFDYYVDLHVEVNGNLSVFEGHEIAHRVKEAILEAMPNISDVLVHIEPEESHQSSVVSQ